jgi:hypothetical protein
MNDPAVRKVVNEYLRETERDETIQQGMDVVRELGDPPSAPPKRQDAPNAGSPAIQVP